MSLRTRVTLLATLTAIVIVVLFGTLVNVAARSTSRSQQDQVLSQLSDAASRRMVQYNPSELRRANVATVVDVGSSAAEFVEVFDGSGTTAYSTGQLNGGPIAVSLTTLREATDPINPLEITQVISNTSVRLNIRPVSHLGEVIGGWVVGGASTTALDQSLTDLTRTTVLLAVAILAMGAAVLSWLTRRTLRPLHYATLTAEAVRRDNDLSRRLSAPVNGDEVGRLATSFNGMLEELEQTHRKLESALKSQRSFVADASHELRTPLTSIRSNIEFLVGRPDVKESDRRSALADIGAESARMSRMVDDLLTLARADAGQHLDCRPVDLALIVDQFTRQASRVHADRAVTVNADTAGPIMVVGNADALTQLLWILVNNAARHTSSGGRVDLDLAREGSEVVLHVTDDGHGIPADDLTRVFERFYQVAASRTDGGTGLGLAIAAWIVEEHHGSIAATNAASHGARFTIRLPFSADS